MENDYLIYIIGKWDKIDWLTKRRIDLLRLKSKWGPNTREIITTFTIIALFFLAIFETSFAHKLTLSSILILVYFYTLLFRKLLPS